MKSVLTKNKHIMKYFIFFRLLLVLTILFPASICKGQTDDELALIIAHDTTDRYDKHIFYTDNITYESGNTNGTTFHTSYILHGKGTSTIQGEEPAERVILYFVSNVFSKKPYYNPKNKTILIFYPNDQFDYIQTLLLNSEKIWAQFFYYGDNNEISYGDIHGKLHHKLEKTPDNE